MHELNSISFYIEFLTIVFEVILFFVFFDNVLKRKFDEQRIYFFAGLILVFVINYIDYIKMFANYKVLIALLMLNLTAYYLYKGRLYHKIFASILIMVLLSIADLTTFSIESILKNVIPDFPPTSIQNRIMMILISKSLFFVLVKLSRKKRISLYNTNLTVMYYSLVILIPLISIMAFFVLFYMVHFTPPNNIIYHTLLLVSVGLLFLNQFILYIFDALLKSAKAQNDAELLHQQYEMQIKHFENIGKSQENIRSIKHDINNHLFCIQHYIEKEQIEDAKAYIANIDNILLKTELFSNSGNVVIDALLNNKYELLQNEKIKINKEIIIEKNINIENHDLCIILSNLLDNAIDACKKVDSEDRFIDLSISCKKEMFIISIANNFADEPIKKGGKYVTLKANKEFHGIGLKNVENTVSKYNGYMNIDVKDKIFRVDVVMCNTKI